MINKVTILFTFLLVNSGLYAMDNLLTAVAHGELDRVSELVHKHPRLVNQCTNKGDTALMYVAGHGHLDVVQFLVEQGADVNAANECGETALLYGEGKKSLPIISYLLAHGARASARAEYGETAAMRAAAQGSLDILRALVNDGCVDLCACDYFGHSMSDFARAACDHSVHHFKHRPQPEITYYLDTLLFEPTIRGDVASVRKLLGQGAFVNGYDADGETPLMIAAGRGYLAIVKSLLSRHGIDVQARKKKNGETAIRMAVQNGRTEVVQTLLDHCANANIPDDGGFTPLMWAAANNKIELVSMLIPHTSIIDRGDHDGCTALMIAASMGNEEIVRLLIDVGHARVNIVDHDGQTAIVYAAKWGRAAVARLLIERRAFQTVLCDRHGALTPTALMVAASVGNEEIVRLLIGAGHALVNIVDTNGQTALMYAAKSGKDAVADLLIEHGAKTALCDRHGARASNLARAAGYLELAQHLAEHASVESLRAKIAYWWEKRS